MNQKYIKKIKIGNVELENNLILAPMAGITDRPFRILCKDFGAGMVCTEMVSSKAIVYQDEKTLKMLYTEGEKAPISIQIFGSDPVIMGKAAQFLNDKADIIDINMGCPAPKVVKNGDGSKLLLNLALVDEIVRAVVASTDLPVTVKMRKGWDQEHIVAQEAAKIIEKAGASAITIHGRTREEYYTGHADWEIIKKVKDSVKIPVLGNGDVTCAEDACHMFEQTGVDGIMLGRATLGAPWIFKRINQYLETGKILPEMQETEKLEVIMRHIDLLNEEKGEYTAVREMRKHISWYIKNKPNAAKMREYINQLEKIEEVKNALKEYYQ